MAAGAGLQRKLGPLPLWLWALGGLLLGYVAYRHFSGASGSSGPAQQSQTVAAATPDTSMGLTPSAGSTAAGGDTGTATSDLISSLGGENASLIAALTQTSQDVVELAASQIAYAQTQTSLGSFSTQTQPVTGPQPGGSWAPIVGYVMPQVVTTPGAKPAASTATGAKQTGASTRYFTYKRDVPLAQGQTVHFTTGRGYYAYG